MFLTKKRSLQKKGSSHIEMITAFSLFFLFILFILTILRPYGTTNLSGAVVADIYDRFEEKTLTNLSKAFVYANTTAPCFNLTLPNEVFVYALTESLVTNLSEDITFDSTLYPSQQTSKLSINDSSSKYYNIYFSPDFSKINFDTSSCEELSDYRLGSILERQVISHDSLKNMKAQYNSNYNGLKNELGIPPTFDFAILIEGDGLPSEDLSMQKGVPDTGEIESREYIKEVLFVEDGKPNVVNTKFNIQVW